MKKTWNIYGLKVRVIMRKRLKHPETGELCMGLFDPEKNIIYIQSELSEQDKWSTLCHEVVHAMQFRMGYMQALPGDFLETMAETFGNIIAENFRHK